MLLLKGGYIQLRKTKKFLKWLKKLDSTQKIVVVTRLEIIKEEGRFGHWKDLGDGLRELKFSSGIRVYFVLVEEVIVLILAGGNKDEQKRQIIELKKDIREFF